MLLAMKYRNTLPMLLAIQSRGGSSGMLPLRRTDGKQKDAGSICLSGVRVVTYHSFVEFLAGGLQINLACAVDFTASNGAPNVPNSLHFLSPQPNQCVRKRAERSAHNVTLCACTNVLWNQ